ncbi:putative reverse transcriptase domain-containing protein [Tanacetum coccineum]
MDLMKRVCKPYLDKFVIVFIDDILIYSKSKEEHEVHLKIILEFPRKEKLYAKFTKCEFWLQEVKLHGHVVNNNGIHMEPSKIESIAKPLTLLTQKNKKFEWSDKQEEAFQTLKEKLCNALVLALLDGPDDFVVYCDASNQGFGCMLMQRGKVIAYASRQLKVHEKNYTTHNLELGAVVFAEHMSLKHIFDQKELNMCQGRWIELFSDYDCEIPCYPPLTKSAHFLPIHEDYKMEKLARIYINEVVTRYSVPLSIISDSASRFTSQFWQTLQKALGTQLNMSTAYHPHTDEEPVEIVDCEVKKIKQRRIPIIKVRSNSKRGAEFTWERKDQFRSKYSHLFLNTSQADGTS